MNVSSFPFLLFDFADVISLPQDDFCFLQMAKLLDLEEREFSQRYWKFRKAYDLGQSGNDYWSRVSNRTLAPELVSELIDWDCKSWGNINVGTLRFVQKMKQQNKMLGVLSNLPIDLVRFLRKNYDFLSIFDHVFFSAEIHLVKPESEIYRFVLRETGTKASDIIFFDDKEENLKGAQEVGMETFLFKNNSPDFLLTRS